MQTNTTPTNDNSNSNSNNINSNINNSNSNDKGQPLTASNLNQLPVEEFSLGKRTARECNEEEKGEQPQQCDNDDAIDQYL